MTGPDRIWLTFEDRGASWSGSYRSFRCTTLDHSEARRGADDYPEYIRRDPAVLAALPEVQALIAAAYEAAAKFLTDTVAEWSCGHDARHCDCWRDKEQWSLAAEAVDGLTPADATAALARIVREAEARGMERAADRARVYASNYEQSSDGRNTFILLAEWADAEAAAILARAAEIEGESGA